MPKPPAHAREDGTPCETPAPISRAQAEMKLRLALGRLGLGIADASNIVCYDPKAATAFWRCNRATGEERIHIGPRVAGLALDAVEVILRHEILHRSMYHAFGERYTNPGLSNLALDICINRLLVTAYPVAMRAASAGMYPEESKTTAIALADCTALPARLPDTLRELWMRIWRRGDRRAPTLSPSSLYYQLLSVGAAQGLPQWYLDGVYAPTAIPSPSMQRAVDRALDDLCKRLPRGSQTAEELSTFTVSPVKLGTDGIEAFLRSMRVRTVISSTIGALKQNFRQSVRIQPFPLFPSRMGIVYHAMGLSTFTHLFWNRDVQPLAVRMALGVYVDVSGSMVQHFAMVVSLVRALREYPLRIRSFDEMVREVEISALSSGKLHGGGGTNFDAPVQDLLTDRDLAAGLLITDGEAALSTAVARELRRSDKPLFVIYLREASHRPYPQDTLARAATSALELPPSTMAAR